MSPDGSSVRFYFATKVTVHSVRCVIVICAFLSPDAKSRLWTSYEIFKMSIGPILSYPALTIIPSIDQSFMWIVIAIRWLECSRDHLKRWKLITGLGWFIPNLNSWLTWNTFISKIAELNQLNSTGSPNQNIFSYFLLLSSFHSSSLINRFCWKLKK